MVSHITYLPPWISLQLIQHVVKAQWHELSRVRLELPFVYNVTLLGYHGLG